MSKDTKDIIIPREWAENGTPQGFITATCFCIRPPFFNERGEMHEPDHVLCFSEAKANKVRANMVRDGWHFVESIVTLPTFVKYTTVSVIERMTVRPVTTPVEAPKQQSTTVLSLFGDSHVIFNNKRKKRNDNLQRRKCYHQHKPGL